MTTLEKEIIILTNSIQYAAIASPSKQEEIVENLKVIFSVLNSSELSMDDCEVIAPCQTQVIDGITSDEG